MELRRSLTQAGVTESVCNIVEKYVEEETQQGTEMEQEGGETQFREGESLEEEGQMVQERVNLTDLRRSLTQAGVNESVVVIVEKYTPGCEDGEQQGGHGGGQGGHGGSNQQGGGMSSVDLRKSLKAAGVTESVVCIVEKYTDTVEEEQQQVGGGGQQGGGQQGGDGGKEESSTRLRISKEEFLRHSIPAQDVVKEYVVDESEQGEQDTNALEQQQQNGSGSPNRLRLTQEEFDLHSQPAQEVVREYLVQDEVQEEVQEELLVLEQQEVVVVEEQICGGNGQGLPPPVETEESGSPNRLRLTREEFDRHSQPAQEVVREYVVDDDQEQQMNLENMTQEERERAQQDGRWGKCSQPAQDILEGYEPEMTQ